MTWNPVFNADNISIGKRAKEEDIAKSHDTLAKAYIKLEELCHEMAKAMDCVTAQLIRVGDDTKDAPFYEPALEVLVKYRTLLFSDDDNSVEAVNLRLRHYFQLGEGK